MKSVKVGAALVALAMGFSVFVAAPANAQQVVQPSSDAGWNEFRLTTEDPHAPSELPQNMANINPIYSINAATLIEQYSSHQLQVQMPTGISLVGRTQSL